MPSASFIEIKNVCKSFGGVPVLQNVSLTLNRGEIHCLAGENGCGKSTLIKIISGYYRKDSGEISIDNNVFNEINPKLAMAKGVQVVYQDLPLYQSLSVAENIVLVDQVQKGRMFVNWKKVKEQAKDALERIKLNIDVNEKVENLSIAKKQLISIAKALYQDAKLVILDEPTTSLTEKEIDVLFDVLNTLAKKGVSILLVSHKLREVLRISSRLTIMRNGQVVISGDTKDFTESSISRYMTGRDCERSIGEEITEFKRESPYLKIENLSCKGQFNNVSMEFKRGEIVGITGLLGSGRSEVVKAIVGLQPYDSGKIIVNGIEKKFSSIGEAVASGLGYVTDDRMSEGIFADCSVKENMISASLASFVKNLTGQLDFDKISEKVNESSKQFNVVMKNVDSKIKYLSGGNAQKVMLGRWLLANVRVLFLNGPTVGVDIGAKFDIYEKLAILKREGLITVIISDDVPELVYNCDRVLVFHKGEIVKELERGEVTEDSINFLLAQMK